MARLTPIEIAEYKQMWMSTGDNNPVPIHSDLRSKALDFCKEFIPRERWKHVKWTDVYEDTFYFETFQEAYLFQKNMK